MFKIEIPPNFFEPLDPDGVLGRMADAADKWRRETIDDYLKYRIARGEPGTWPVGHSYQRTLGLNLTPASRDS